MAKRQKTIRSHRERVRRANYVLKEDPYFKKERLSILDREALVEFYLVEDILQLYQKRLASEQAYEPHGRAAEKAKALNIKKFTAIINVLDAAIGVARAAIKAGDYTKVRRAIHEGALMAAANSVKNLPELRELAIELLRDLSADTLAAESESLAIDEDLDDLESHEENVRKVKGMAPSVDQIEEIIRAAEEAIPDKITKSKLNTNI